MPRLGSEARLERLLALVPWVAAQDGPRVDEVCRRFDVTEADLAADLELLFLCGLYPYTPDVLIDVDFADGRVWIRYAPYFSRPLRLTAAEGLALLAAGNTLLAVPGSDPDGPLARGLAKLAKVLGVDAHDSVQVAIGSAPSGIMDVLRDAVRNHRRVRIDYYSFGRDSVGERVIDPYAVFSAAGQWYLTAYCHSVDDERVFRIDRVRGAVMLDEGFGAPPQPPELSVFEPSPGDPRVTLELEPAARWVIEQYPVEQVEELEGGRWRVVMVAGARAWLERLLLRLGPDATVIDAEPDLAGSGREAATRILARYRAAGPRPLL